MFFLLHASGCLKLTDTDLHILRTSYIPHTLSECITDIENATSHNAVIENVKHLRLILAVHTTMTGHIQLLGATHWKQALTR